MNSLVKRAVLAAISLISIDLCAQSYDQLKTQLQFENYYGTRMRSTGPGSELTGSECLEDNWLPVEVTLPSGTVSFDRGKLNLVNATVEVMYKEREMFISSEHFKTVKVVNQGRWFMPGSKYAKQGLLEIFEPAPVTPFIVVQYYVYVKEPNSNGYINGGSLNKELMQAKKVFLIDGEKLIPIKGKGSLQKFYAKDKDLFTKKRKELKVDFKNPKSIHSLVLGMEAALKK